MAERTWSDLLVTLLRQEELSTADTAWAMGEIVAGQATPAQIAAFAVGLRAKGETAGEIAGLVEAMLAAATRVDLAEALGAGSGRDAVDVVGTGGDRARTVNISTMAALVVAGAGVRVIKHGNRAASSQCGTADLIEHFGIALDLNPQQVAACVRRAGIGFCFAPRFHAGLRHAAAARREMGIPTAFNVLGPLTNPAQPRAAAIGCADLRMAPIMAEVLARRGDSALVMRGQDGLDEFTTTAPTAVWVVAHGSVHPLVVDAGDLGIARASGDDLRGGDVSVNADAARAVLAGEAGPVRDAVLLNAAAALVAYDGLDLDATAGSSPAHLQASVITGLQTGLARAADAVDSGAARAVLDTWIDVARELSGTCVAA
jgi:anthranilate phosphoribosyltransferase